MRKGPHTDGRGRRPLQVLIADDHPIRWGLAQGVPAEPDLDVVRTAKNGVLAVELNRAGSPDVVLFDLSMAELDGVTTAEQFRQRSPGTRVLVLSSHPQESEVTAAFLAGASEYLTKDVPSTDVLDGIRHVHAGRTMRSDRLGAHRRKRGASTYPA